MKRIKMLRSLAFGDRQLIGDAPYDLEDGAADYLIKDGSAELIAVLPDPAKTVAPENKKPVNVPVRPHAPLASHPSQAPEDKK